MSEHDPIPMPTEADLARVNDALDAVVSGRTARVPGTIAADAAWLTAFGAVRDALRSTDPTDGLDAARDAAVAAALAAFDTEQSSRRVPPPVAATLRPVVDTPTAVEPAPTADDLPTATVVHPLRWRRVGMVMSAAAAVLLVGGAVVSLQGRSADLDSGAADQAGGAVTLAGDAMAESVAADTAGQRIENAPPGPTIDAISTAAVAAPSLDTPDQLLDLARAFEADLGSTDTTAPSGVSVASATGMVPGYGCPLGPDQVVLAEVLWQGTLGVAVYDTATGVVSVVDPTCTELTAVGP